MIVLFILFLYTFPLLKSEETIGSVSVDTSLGKVLGKREGNVISYLGIPYAEPPIGKLRFKPPVPKRPWAPHVHNAYEYGYECLQSTLYSMDNRTIPRKEDCLYLNIWRPAKARMGNIPILFWVYGGAFIQGAASKLEYVGNKLASRGVIVVSCNYRLGALGFLVSTADGLFGNYGIADQRLAMQWVQDNIQAFGGDPSRVTLFGESAGAMSIGLHFLDQVNRPVEARANLFNAIILQSNPLGYRYRNVVVANFLGADYKESLDCEDLRCLQSESADELIHVQDTLMAVPRSIGDFFTWGPVLTDHHYQREVRLRPGHVADIQVLQPINTLKKLSASGIPIIMGTNSHEGNVFVYTAFPAKIIKPVYMALIISFFRRAAGRVLKVYASLAKRVAASDTPDYRKVLSTIIGDYLFRCPNQLAAALLHSAGAPVHLYEFSLATKTPGYHMCSGLACHTAELPYVFDQTKIIADQYSWFYNDTTKTYFPSILKGASTMLGVGRTDISGHAIDNKVAKLMADYWATFATFGDPNGLRVSNGYRYRPDNAPWWPRLLGDLPSNRAIREVRKALRSAAINYKGVAEYDPDFDFGDDLIDLEDEATNYQSHSKSKTMTMAVAAGSDMDGDDLYSGRFTHMFQFDINSEISVVESDCVCEFWNEMNYKF